MSNEDAVTLLRRNRELSILNQIAEALNRSLDLDEALDNVLSLVAELLNLRSAWIWLLDEESGEPFMAASQYLPPALADYPERMTGTCYCLDTFKQGDLTGAANVNVVTCSRLKWLDGTEGLRYHASIPIYSHESKLGVLNVASTDWRELGPEDLKLLYTIGYQLGIAVERARLFGHKARSAKIEERNRLAREIHDTLAQGLTAISWQLESADALIDETPQRAKETIRKALELTRHNLEEVRRSVLDLRAASLLDNSLPDALRMLTDQIERDHDLSIEVRSEGDVEHVPARVAMGIYRIVQEGLNNVVRHAAATSVMIDMSRAAGSLHVIIEDDGMGFDPQTDSAGFGLIGMRERAHLLHGALKVESALGQGTRLIVEVSDS